jgi:hypothetical protein
MLDKRNPLPDNRTQISAAMCVFVKLFVHDLLYKFIDSIDWRALACIDVLWRALACSGVH